MIESQRHLFSIPDDVHYINCAYMAPSLKRVEAAGIEGIKSKSAPWQIATEAFYEPSEQIRRLVAQLINTRADRVAIIPAVSYGMAIAANATALRPGQNIVLPAEEFPSVVYAWRERCRASGAEIRTVRRPERVEGQGAAWNERLLDAIDENTAVVALTAIHWTDGSLFDLTAIGARARETGAAFIVDGTQSVGALPFDFSELRPDLLLCAGYKWLMGPYSLGFAVFGDRFIDASPLEHNWITRKHSEDFANLVHYQDEFRPGARRFDVGERSNFVLTPMLIAALEQVLSWTPDKVQTYCARLGDRLRELLDGSPYRFNASSERAAHLFGIRSEQASTVQRMQKELMQRNVYVSLRGDAVRVSPHLYNSEEDMATLAEALWAAAD